MYDEDMTNANTKATEMRVRALREELAEIENSARPEGIKKLMRRTVEETLETVLNG
jgi:hypothetical protein